MVGAYYNFIFCYSNFSLYFSHYVLFSLAFLLKDFLIAEFPSLVSVLMCLLDLDNGSDSQQTQFTKGQQWTFKFSHTCVDSELRGHPFKLRNSLD